MIRTYKLGMTGPRRPESLRAILRRLEREIAVDATRLDRRSTGLTAYRPAH